MTAFCTLSCCCNGSEILGDLGRWCFFCMWVSGGPVGGLWSWPPGQPPMIFAHCVITFHSEQGWWSYMSKGSETSTLLSLQLIALEKPECHAVPWGQPIERSTWPPDNRRYEFTSHMKKLSQKLPQEQWCLQMLVALHWAHPYKNPCQTTWLGLFLLPDPQTLK
jgi:hypothetical protein